MSTGVCLFELVCWMGELGQRGYVGANKIRVAEIQWGKVGRKDNTLGVQGEMDQNDEDLERERKSMYSF